VRATDGESCQKESNWGIFLYVSAEKYGISS